MLKKKTVCWRRHPFPVCFMTFTSQQSPDQVFCRKSLKWVCLKISSTESSWHIMQASHQGHEVCSCPITGDAKCDHMVKADAHEIPPLAKVPFFPLKLLSRVWSGPVKLGQGPDLSTHLHQWLWHLEDSCLNHYENSCKLMIFSFSSFC